jgi:hypothetical protein
MDEVLVVFKDGTQIKESVLQTEAEELLSRFDPAGQEFRLKTGDKGEVEYVIPPSNVLYVKVIRKGRVVK